MKIDRVVITGADDSIEPMDLIELSTEFPFVEWGILLSKKSIGKNRFPSEGWLDRLYDISNEHNLKLSGHLCGKWVRDITFGEGFTFIDEMSWIYGMFDRFQLNFHAIVHEVKTPEFLKALKRVKDVQYIFQLDNVNNKIVDIAKEANINCSALFDTSGGIGLLPNSWPKAKEGLYCGYAGGLSPSNLKEELSHISLVAGDEPIWIDVETHVRSDHDKQFDLALVRQFLEVAKPFVP